MLIELKLLGIIVSMKKRRDDIGEYKSHLYVSHKNNVGKL
jgi:hypothetical protein